MKQVLLVEDNAYNREVIEDIFNYESVPGKLVCVDSGEKALQIIPSLDLLVILMDIGLPGLDGVATTLAIKRDPATRSIPVWAITAGRSRAEVDAALDAGCSGYFVKPIDTAKVANDLRALQVEAVFATLTEGGIT